MFGLRRKECNLAYVVSCLFCVTILGQFQTYWAMSWASSGCELPVMTIISPTLLRSMAVDCYKRAFLFLKEWRQF